jgi:Holliday junction resolvasome RuvABC endonuclease subunit
MTPRLLALDLSLTRSGVCEDELPPGAGGFCQSIRTGKLRGMERIDAIVRDVQAFAKHADLVVIEGYSYASPNQAHQIGELGGCVRFLLWRLGIPHVDVAPSTLKKYATGKGNANKDAMIAAAIRRFGFAGSDNNEADAYMLWCLAREAYGEPVAPVPALQRDAAMKVAWPELVG